MFKGQKVSFSGVSADGKGSQGTQSAPLQKIGVPLTKTVKPEVV